MPSRTPDTPARPHRFLLHGHLGRGNVGDEAMLQVIGALLHERAPGSELVVAYGGDTQPATRLPAPVRFAPRTFRAILSALRDCDFFVIAGGTHLTCFGSNRRAKLLGILRQMIPVLAARLLGVKVLMLSVGIGPFNSSVARLLVRHTLRHVAFISVRDAESESELRNLGYGGPQSRCSDAAYFLDYGGHAGRAGGPCLGVSALPYFATHMGDGAGDVALADALASAIRAWLHHFPEGKVLLLPVCTQQGAVSDTTMTVRILQALDGDSRVGERALHGNPDALLEALGTLTHFIGMRYHSVLLAGMAGVPTINIAYHEKSLQLARELALPEVAVLSVEGALAGDLVRRIPEFCASPEGFRAVRRAPAFGIEAILPQSIAEQMLDRHEDS